MCVCVCHREKSGGTRFHETHISVHGDEGETRRDRLVAASEIVLCTCVHRWRELERQEATVGQRGGGRWLGWEQRGWWYRGQRVFRLRAGVRATALHKVG